MGEAPGRPVLALTDQQYTARLALPDELVRAQANTIKCPLYLDGALVAPTEAGSTVSVYDDSNTAIVSAAAVTVTADVAEYTISAGTLPATLTLAKGWRVEWSLVVGAAINPDAVVQARNPAALVRHRLSPAISDVDLYRQVPALDPNDAAPITRATNYQDFIDEAWTQIRRELYRLENRPHLIMEPSSLAEPHKLLTLAFIFEDLASRNAVQYESRAKAYRDQYRTAWAGLRPIYDTDDDGQADTRRRPMSPTLSLCGGRDAWEPRLGRRYGRG